jgi:transcriptional regulator with XRE-family HTH domain
MTEAAAEPVLTFAGLLRQLRAEARLTQEELAEAAGLSPRSVSDLERGINRTARKDTAILLADALSLTGEVRVLFIAAARGRAEVAEVLAAKRDEAAGPGGTTSGTAAATRSLPRDIGSFTGREPELARLLGSLADLAAGGGLPGVCVIDGMPGIGKTTLVVHAAHRLARASLTGSSSFRCARTPPATGRSARPTRWPACQNSTRPTPSATLAGCGD